MILFPNCKINLGLHVLRKREDGFHDLEMGLYPIALHDALEVVHHSSSSNNVEFSRSGLIIEGELTNNICIKAYRLLKKDFPELPPVKMHLHKTIVVGAGLGGGSADGAFTLFLLNKKFNLGLTESQLISYALQLGSDCPFFIKNTPCYATGRGEKLEPVPLNLSTYKIVLVNPGVHVSTGWAFSQIMPSADRPSIKEIISLSVHEWQGRLTNDFEKTVAAHHPEIGNIKQTLLKQGAVYASMTGSGSTVFGIFRREDEPAFSFPEHYFVKTV